MVHYCTKKEKEVKKIFSAFAYLRRAEAELSHKGTFFVFKESSWDYNFFFILGIHRSVIGISLIFFDLNQLHNYYKIWNNYEYCNVHPYTEIENQFL